MKGSFGSNEPHLNKIDMNKKYRTRCGFPVRVLCVDRKDPVWKIIFVYTATDGDENIEVAKVNGRVSTFPDFDLIEVSPWEDFKKDDKVMVRDHIGDVWTKAHFAFERNGYPFTYAAYGTSWTCGDVDAVEWKYCRKPTKEELGEEQLCCFDNGDE